MPLTGDYDFKETEEKWMERWEEMDIYSYNPESKKPVFSIDTPPPTISGEMHIGHAYSYTQMDIMARYKRMQGHNLFYPWGWDDNGIATELFVINETGVDPKEVGREKFRDICIEESEKLEEKLERKWKRIGTSADFDLFYRTIDERTLKTSQKSFIDLYEMGREYRKEAPTLWCPHCETAISQVETEDMEKEGKFNNIHFSLKDGDELVISTTRPELLPACIAIFVHPDDEEHNHLAGRKAEVPLFGQEVPIYEDEEVDMETGTGVVMCCTFGDQADIDWWYAHDLPLRIAIDETGYMTDVAEDYEGLHVEEAKEKIIQDLKGAGKISKQWDITHEVNVHERCDTPIEFLVTEQWFIEYLDLRDKYLDVGDELDWHPDHMKVRYDNWVDSLKWDWCISRQRYHGIPFPVWYCEECGEVKLADEDNLPVNPLVDEPRGECESCGSTEFEPEEDVLDTWATSSLTPYIATRWIENSEMFEEVFPFDLRPQSHDIISFWAFNTIVKSLFHSDTKPWDDIMIHGYLMLPGGKSFSSSKGIIIDPEEVAEEHGADSIRYLAGIHKPGEDGEYEEKWLKRGQRIRTKFWNAQKLISNTLEGKPKEKPSLKLIDKWLLTKYSELVKEATRYMDDYRYDKALQETEYFLWHVLADHYLEMVKYRIYEREDKAVEYVLYQVGLGLTKLLAPFLSFITEEVYDQVYKEYQGEESIHVESWPEPILKDEDSAEIGEIVKDIIAEIRNWKSDQGIPLNEEIGSIRLIIDNEDVLECEDDILNTLNASEMQILEEDEINEEAVNIKPDHSKIGPKYKDQADEVFQKLEKSDPEEVRSSFENNGYYKFELSDGNEVTLTEEEVQLKKSKVHGGETLDSLTLKDMVILLEKQ
ncbi:MAG: valine--tRNA ligase [Candidatus Thermoplasmatota archaeon]